MNKLIITRWNGSVITLLQSKKETLQIDLEPEDSHSFLGNIYIGKVNNIVKNINAAFVDIGDGQMGYLSLADSSIHFANQRPYEGKLRQGDEIIVQVERDAVKTKAPVLTGNLNITGQIFCSHFREKTDRILFQNFRFCLERGNETFFRERKGRLWNYCKDQCLPCFERTA